MKALRRLALLLAALLALPWAALAEDEYWDAYDRPVVCCENRTGCEERTGRTLAGASA